jgi:hypothetical protein
VGDYSVYIIGTNTSSGDIVGPLTIAPGSPEIVSPSSSKTWVLGTTVHMEWKSKGLSSSDKLTMSLVSGNTSYPVGFNLNLTDFYDWNVSGIPVGTYNLKLCSSYNTCDMGPSITIAAQESSTPSSQPTISYVSPLALIPGDKLNIYGSNFNRYTFAMMDGVTGLDASSYTSTRLLVTIPSSASIGSHTVQVSEKGSSFGLSNSGSFSVMSSQTNTDTTSTLQALLDKIKALQAQLADLTSGSSSELAPNTNGMLTSSCVHLVHELTYRSRDIYTNGDVSALQDFLQANNYLNSEPTGYFGLLTTQAVKNFQIANGINSTGYVGPLTKARIQALSCR